MIRLMEILSKSRLIGWLIIFLLVLASHGNIFQNKFVMDDFDFIVDWPLIQDWKNLPRFFIGYTPPPGQEGIYSPFKTIFHAINYHLFGLDPLGYHIVSLLIHGLGVYFVYSLCARLTGNNFTAFVSSLLFALHPVQVEAITYMTASIDMIGIVFLFMSFFYYLKAGDDPYPVEKIARGDNFGRLCSLKNLVEHKPICFPQTDKGKINRFSEPAFLKNKFDEAGIVMFSSRLIEGKTYAPSKRYTFLRGKKRFYILSLVFASLAIFTHELAISLPLLFLWYEFCFSKARGGFAKAVGKTAPFFIWTAVYVLAKFFVLGSITRGEYLYDSFYLTMLVTLKAFAKYVYLCFVPAVLTHNQVISGGISSFDQEDFDKVVVLTQSIFDPSVLSALFVLGSILFWGFNKWKAEPLVPFCIGWFFISLLPVSNIIPSRVFFGERYLYGALLGFCLLLGLYADKLCRSQTTFSKISTSTLTVLLVIGMAFGYGLRTWMRNRDWRDEITLYESAVKGNPHSALMRTDLGIVYTNKGFLDKAVESFKQALKIRSDDPATYFSLAEAYAQMDRRSEAAEALRKAIDLKPDYGEAYYNLAGIYAMQGDIEQARTHLDKFLFYYKAQNRFQEAQEFEESFKRFFVLVK